MRAFFFVAAMAAAPLVFAQAPTTVPAVLSQYANLVHANYDDALAAAQGLRKAVASFVAQPSAEHLQAARKSWLDARETYGQTEAFRFYGGPIDDANGPEGRINAWPMDESFVDGLIDKRKLAITKKTLAVHNERGGEENIATGWHAIEFLLWGRDSNERGPGERGGSESLRKIFVGLGSLSRGELAGERLEVALASQDQEDEHSCFSDNTHRDVVANALGIENVWLGRYRRADGRVLQGASLRELVVAKDTALAERVSKQIAASVAAAGAIQPPFDREIVGGADAPGRTRVRGVIDSLVRQSHDLVAAANAVGITRLTLVQPK